MRDWLDGNGCFLFGKHKGKQASDIAKSDPDYVEWVIREVEDIDSEDRESLSILLRYRGRL